MAFVGRITPVVWNIHYDDVEQLFKLHVSRQNDTPQGVYREELKDDFGTFEDVLREALLYWALAQDFSTGIKVNAPMGNLAVLGIYLADPDTGYLEEEIIATPDPAPVATGPDNPDYELDLEGDDPFGTGL
jgi:hypothetical protein